jgi:acyl-CoA reductase-like NAD-dependent aldehyde dehydrogenase
VLVPSWSATWHAPARAAFFALLAGRPVVLAPDGRAAAVGDALRDAGRDLPPGVLAVLHDDGRTLARAALAARHAATVVVAAERLDPLAVSAPHVVVAHARRRSAVVDPGQDVAAQVERALDLALGRARALSGSRGGCVGRLIVPARHYARVCDLALSGVERSSDARRPLPVALATQADRLASCLSLGLGEGATALVAGLLDGGAPFPLLFANVEPAMRLAQDPLPCAALLLLRARDLRAAHALAGRLDREVRS